MFCPWVFLFQALSRVLKATRLLAGSSYHQKLEAGPGSRGLPPQFGPGYRPFGTASINVMNPMSFRVRHLYLSLAAVVVSQPMCMV